MALGRRRPTSITPRLHPDQQLSAIRRLLLNAKRTSKSGHSHLLALPLSLQTEIRFQKRRLPILVAPYRQDAYRFIPEAYYASYGCAGILFENVGRIIHRMHEMLLRLKDWNP